MVFLFWSKGMKYLKHALLDQVPYREKHVVYRVMIEFPAEIKFGNNLSGLSTQDSLKN